jgi:geranylgeranyl reductase family protein
MVATGSSEPIGADVLVVGAGPAGSTAAYHLARSGVDVLLLERAAFPREKACGDGLSPRAVRALLKMGIDANGPPFERVIGLRTYSRTTAIELLFPKLEDLPNYGLTCKRSDLDEILARRARAAGARLMERTEAASLVRRDGWVAGARIRRIEDGEDAPPVEVRARFVIAGEGASAGLASQVGARRIARRPLGVAARRYYRIARRPGPWFESWIDLWEGDSQLPGYGWLFPLADGTVNVGAGLLSTFRRFQDVSAKRLFAAFAEMMPDEWGVSEETALGPVLSGPLPMGLSRTPPAVPGLLVAGDAAGMVNPFNGEGIAYAMESGEVAAELVHEAIARDRPALAQMYPTVLRERYGRYFAAGRGFARVIGDPRIMRASTRLLLPNRKAMAFALRVLGNLTDGSGGDAQDRLMYALERMVPAS